MNSFSDDDFRDLPPRERRYEIQVADNLFFAVFPNGVKTWVLVYRFEGIVRRQTLGTFPEMPLAQALREADKDPGTAEPEAPAPADRKRPLRPLIAVGVAAGAALLCGAAYMVVNSGSPSGDPGQDRATTTADRPEGPLMADRPPSSTTIRPGPDSEPVPAPAPRATAARATSERAVLPPAGAAEARASAPADRQGDRGPDIRPAVRPEPRQTDPAIVAGSDTGPDARSAAIAPVASPGETVQADVSGAEFLGGDGNSADAHPQGPPEARRALLALDVVDREPVGSVSDVLSASPDVQRVYFYTDVRNAGGSEIVHRWLLDGTLMAERRFSVGGNYRWRVFSAKDLEPAQLGTWRVELRDGHDRLLAEQAFVYAEDTPRLTVTDGAAESPGSSSR